VVYISTAGVFDGKKKGPYDELDTPNPINVYGATKFAGEGYVARLPRHYIVRAGWMIGGHALDHKFIAKVRAQINAGLKVISAVDDKWGTPTYTVDFAENLLDLVSTPYYGLYHMVSPGMGTRYDVALVPVGSDFFDDIYSAPRPRSEMMTNRMLALRGLNAMRPWRDALRAYLSSSSEGS
jgi:dTDP-4-dehydrorhamnose reductase